MPDAPDLSTIMQQVGPRGFVPPQERPDLGEAMRTAGHRGWEPPGVTQPERPEGDWK